MIKGRFPLFFLVAAVTVVLDLASKALVESRLASFESVEVIEGFLEIVNVRNPGAAFGLFAQNGSWKVTFFLLFTTVALGVILWVVKKLERGARAELCGLALIFGGAVGNLVDRVRYGEVVDFIDFQVAGHHWPAFNVADAAITVGVVIVLVCQFFFANTSGRGE